MRTPPWIELPVKIAVIIEPDIRPDHVVILPGGAVSFFSACQRSLRIASDPHPQVEAAGHGRMKQADSLDAKDSRRWQELRLAKRSAVPIQWPDVHGSSILEWREYFVSQASTVNSVPIRRTPVDCRRIEEIVDAHPDAGIEPGHNVSGHS